MSLEASTESDSVVLRRVGTAPICNVPWRVQLHSPLGFDWGYDGSEPAELALNILLHYTDAVTARKHYQAFKRDFIVDMPRSGGVIRRQQVIDWLERQER